MKFLMLWTAAFAVLVFDAHHPDEPQEAQQSAPEGQRTAAEFRD